MSPEPDAYLAFEGDRCIASGELHEVARAVKDRFGRRKEIPVLIFDRRTGGPIDIDFSGGIADVLARLPETTKPQRLADDVAAPASRGPGRPRLGVVAREVTLLPRHWDWLARQRGGASVALRRLVDDARRTNQDKDRIHLAQEAACCLMSALAGNRPNYEAAIRALYAGDAARFAKSIADWPADVRDHTSRLAEPAFRGGLPPSAS